MSGFFVTSEVAEERHTEIAERDRLHHERQTAEASLIELFITVADDDRESAQIVALAQMLSPDCWATRETWLNMADRERGLNASGNERTEQRHRNMAALAVEHSLTKARRARDLVRSWG